MNDTIGIILLAGAAAAWVWASWERGSAEKSWRTCVGDELDALTKLYQSCDRELRASRDMIVALLALRQADRAAAKARHAALRRRLFIASMGAQTLNQAIAMAKQRKALKRNPQKYDGVAVYLDGKPVSHAGGDMSYAIKVKVD